MSQLRSSTAALDSWPAAGCIDHNRCHHRSQKASAVRYSRSAALAAPRSRTACSASCASSAGRLTIFAHQAGSQMAAYASGVTEGLKDPASLTCLQVTAAYFACLRVAGLSLGLVNQVPDEAVEPINAMVAKMVMPVLKRSKALDAWQAIHGKVTRTKESIKDWCTALDDDQTCNVRIIAATGLGVVIGLVTGFGNFSYPEEVANSILIMLAAFLKAAEMYRRKASGDDKICELLRFSIAFLGGCIRAVLLSLLGRLAALRVA